MDHPGFRFNKPPNWPPPPAGWTPLPGWEPDPAWGPAPYGWPLWVPFAPIAPTEATVSAPTGTPPVRRHRQHDLVRSGLIVAGIGLVLFLAGTVVLAVGVIGFLTLISGLVLAVMGGIVKFQRRGQAGPIQAVGVAPTSPPPASPALQGSYTPPSDPGDVRPRQDSAGDPVQPGWPPTGPQSSDGSRPVIWRGSSVPPGRERRQPLSAKRVLIGLAAGVGVLFVVGSISRATSDKPDTSSSSTIISNERSWPVDGGRPFENVDDQVRLTNAGASWLGHIQHVGPAGSSPFDVFDLQVDTDLDEDSRSDTLLAIEICKAYEAASASDKGIVVNGVKHFAQETSVDGSGLPRKSVKSKVAANNFGEDVNNCSKA